MCVCVCERERVTQLCLTLYSPMNCSLQVPLSVGFFQQEHWNGWPFPLPGALPDPGIEPMSPASPALQAVAPTAEPPGKPRIICCFYPNKGSPGGSAGEESACKAGDPGSIPALGRSPGEGKGYPVQYSCLENPMNCIVHGIAKSRIQLSNFHFTQVWNSLYL